ncbi:MAG: 4Fe-4S dicluster domain-containing protein [Peptococcaceae bacterium]|nr:4Fe-4S dicluster domain-containing protein [Peptococcaceae bacterium]
MKDTVIHATNTIAIRHEMRNIARNLLEIQAVDLILGWKKGILPNKSAPAFIHRPDQVDDLIFDEFCYHNLTKFLLGCPDRQDRIADNEDRLKTAIFVKGCDSRSLIGLIQDNQITRENVYIIGIDCPGLKEEHNTTILAKKCETCYTATPVEYDILIDSPDKRPENPNGLKGFQAHRDLAKIENMPPAERGAYWQQMFQSCIRCYACRNVCPVCSCKECCFDQTLPNWVGKGNNTSDNGFYHLVRAMHVAGRCVSCGECERSCPMHLPVMLLNSKLGLSIEELFDEPPASMNFDVTATLNHFKPEDPEEFM